MPLKALCNNAFTLKKSELHAPTCYQCSVFLIRCKYVALKKIAQRSENRQVTGFILPISPYAIDYCVRINTKPDHLLSGDIKL